MPARRAGGLKSPPSYERVTALTVSAQSNDAGSEFPIRHPQLKGIVDLPLQAMSDISEFSAGADVVFLATAHEVSHDLAPSLLPQAAWCSIYPARFASTMARSTKNTTVSPSAFRSA